MIRRAMVLAAGKGTRLAPLTHTLPKPLMPIAGAPLLAHILEFLRAGGIDDVVINLHHLGERIEEVVGDGARFGLRVRYSWERDILDTGGGIKHAEPLLRGEPFVVCNGDSLLELRLADVIAHHESHGGIVTLALRPSPEAARYGLVELDDRDRVRRIAGLPPFPVSEPVRGFMFPGLHVLQPEIFDWMDAGTVFGIAKVTYPKLLEAGRAIHGFVTDARWINIDTPEALADADRRFREAPFRYDHVRANARSS
jgi:NDP-sugar pyrophosphorylase family protein